MLRGKGDADWAELVQSWKRTQEEMRGRIVVQRLRPLPRFVAGADAAFSRDKQWVYAAAVIYDREEQRIVEAARARREAEFPYVPGFLSFREGPAVLEAIGKLRHSFGAICFDGQGYAHPRRCGLAAHVAVTLDVPGVGAAKSRLIGTWGEPDAKAGSFSPLMDGEEQIGIVLRTRDGTRPMFVSVGHKVDLESARELVLACCTRFRMPEPTRQADIEVAKMKREENDSDD
jgi:deoxyribonuclease V